MRLRRTIDSALILAVFLAVAAPAYAQEVTTRGVVASVDVVGGSIRLRKVNGGYQDIQVAPDAELRVAGRTVVLSQVPLNSDADVLVWRDPGGGLHAARVVVPLGRPETVLPIAGLPNAGSPLEGEVVGFLPITATLALRTPTGVRNVELGTAPLMMNGREVTPFDLAIGDRIRIVQAPQEPGLAPRPAIVIVLPSERVAGERETFRAMAAANATRPPTPPVAVSPVTTPGPGASGVSHRPITGTVIAPADEPGILIAPAVGSTQSSARAHAHARHVASRKTHVVRKTVSTQKHIPVHKATE